MPAILKFPSNSPDRNALERVWGWMKDYVEKKQPKTKEDLIILIVEAWEMIPIKIINNYIDYTCDMIPQTSNNREKR